MTDVTIYHNPACGTSRNTLALIRNSGAEPRIIAYLETPPSRDELRGLMEGKRPNRDDPDEPQTPRGSAVPTSGKPRPPEAEGGMEPQPQG